MPLEARSPERRAMPGVTILHAFAWRAKGADFRLRAAGLVLTFPALVLLSLTCPGYALAS
jgi:uncharacterized membrane protein YecN with MAPEG domain